MGVRCGIVERDLESFGLVVENVLGLWRRTIKKENLGMSEITLLYTTESRCLSVVSTF